MVFQGLLGLLGGIFAFLLRDDADLQAHWTVSSNVIAAGGILAAVLGLITLVLARSLSHGGKRTRMLVGVVSAVTFGSAIWGLIARAGTARANGIVQALVALAVLQILFANKGSKEFFGVEK